MRDDFGDGSARGCGGPRRKRRKKKIDPPQVGETPVIEGRNTHKFYFHRAMTKPLSRIHILSTLH